MGTIVRMKVSAGAIKQNRYVYVKYVPILFYFFIIFYFIDRGSGSNRPGPNVKRREDGVIKYVFQLTSAPVE